MKDSSELITIDGDLPAKKEEKPRPAFIALPPQKSFLEKYGGLIISAGAAGIIGIACMLGGDGTSCPTCGGSGHVKTSKEKEEKNADSS